MLGQSVIVNGIIGTLAGVAAGELAATAVRHTLSVPDEHRAVDLTRKMVHGVTAAGVSSAISIAMADGPGLLSVPFTSITTAELHGRAAEFYRQWRHDS